MTMQPMTLTLDNLTFERNQQTLFAAIQLVLQNGEYLQVQGTNGSGKSTFLRILAGLIEPAEGRIFWNEQPISENRDSYQHQLHYLGHQNGHKRNLTLAENLQLTSALKQQKNNNVGHVINKVGLKKLEHKLINHLSAGQLRRASLARLLLHDVPLWILDEPITALDAKGQELFFAMINHHLQQGGIAVIATHQPLSLTGKEKKLFLGGEHA